MIRRRRPIARAAMLGGVGYAAYRAGRNVESSSQHEAYQDQRMAEMEAQQQVAPAAPMPAAAPVAAPPAAVQSPAQRIEALTQLKALLDAGAISAEEFEAQKRQLLAQ